MSSVKEADLSILLDAVKSGRGADGAFAELVERYLPLMQSRALEIIGQGYSSEAMQEANIALHKAAVTYNPEKCEGVTFGLYASICISNRLRSLGRKIRRDTKYSDKFADRVDEQIPDSSDLESFMATKDLCERVLKAARAVLSGFEYEVFRLSIEQYTTAGISAQLGKSAKSVDNAKSRISRKLRENREVCNILSDIY